MKQIEKTILGPPGCGKTHTNTLLIKQCIEDGIAPQRIACVSFTRKAAQESRERVCRDLGISEKDLPYFQTLHSMAFRTGDYKKEDVIRGKDLWTVGSATGVAFNGKETSEIESDFDVIGISKGDQYLNVYQLGRNKRLSLDESFRLFASYSLNWVEFLRLVKAYESYKRANNKVDFTDMIERFIDRGQPIDIEALFVDEAQDLSTLQWDMIEVLRRRPRIKYFTGDDDQAIMGFQGADVGRFLNATKDKQVLEKSYRLPKQPWHEAQRIVSRIHNRAPKTWNPRSDNGSVRWHQSLQDIPLHEGEWTIMGRTNHIVSGYANMLRDDGIVFSRNGRLSISQKTYSAVQNWQALITGAPITAKQIRDIYSFMSSGVGFKRGYGPRSKALLALDEQMEITYEYAVQSLGLMVERGKDWNFALDKLDTDTQVYILSALKRGENLDSPRIKLSTIHSMKGGENENIVVIPDLSPAAYQSYMHNPDIEHRIYYVAVTRSKSTLHFIEPQTNKFYTI